jgi:hypothetical protein
MPEIGAIHSKAVINLDNRPNRDYRSLPPSSAMSESKFDKAVAIIQGLPKDGPVKPSVDDQLYVCPPFRLFSNSKSSSSSSPQFYKYFKQGMGQNSPIAPTIQLTDPQPSWATTPQPDQACSISQARLNGQNTIITSIDAVRHNLIRLLFGSGTPGIQSKEFRRKKLGRNTSRSC